MQNPSGLDVLEGRCMDLGVWCTRYLHLFARFCKHDFDASKMCVCESFFGQAVLKGMSKNAAVYSKLKHAKAIDSRPSTFQIRIRVVLVLALVFLLQK